MKNYYLVAFLSLSFFACLKKEGKKNSPTTQIAIDSLITNYTVVGESLVIPAFEIEVRPSDKAAQTLKSKKETVMVSAMFSGFPIDKKDEDEIGQMPILDTIIELSVDNRVARFENIKFPKTVYNKLKDKDIDLLINVYTGRKSSEDNLIDAGIVQKKASEFKDKRFVLNYKLIEEPSTVEGGSSELAACYALPPAPKAPITELQILIECDSLNNMKWGDKPIKDFDAFKKIMTTELNTFKKQGAKELPNLKVEGCMMGASGELHTLYNEVKAAVMNPSTKQITAKTDVNKPKTTEVNVNKSKPVVTAKSVTIATPSVTLNQNGGITLAGKSIALENLKKVLQGNLTEYAVIPDKIDLKTIGETGMGMRAEVNTEINSAIAGAKWIRKKAALEALNATITKKMTLTTQLELADYQTYANYAFVVAAVRQANGKPVDFTKTPFKKEYQGGVFSEDVFGVLKYDNGKWKVIDYSLGATDVPYGCWWKEHNIPKALFKKYEEALCEDDSKASPHKSETVRFAKGKSDAALTRTINSASNFDFNISAKKGQTMSFTIGYDFKDSDVEGFLTEPGQQDISLTTEPKKPNEFKVKRTGNHRLTVHNYTKKNVTITLYISIE
jgi:hypothetical protein